MKLTIFLEIDNKKYLWKFHEIELPQHEFDLLRDKMNGVVIANPLRTNVLLKPNFKQGASEIYKVDKKAIIYMDFDKESCFLIGKLCN